MGILWVLFDIFNWGWEISWGGGCWRIGCGGCGGWGLEDEVEVGVEGESVEDVEFV